MYVLIAQMPPPPPPQKPYMPPTSMAGGPAAGAMPGRLPPLQQQPQQHQQQPGLHGPLPRPVGADWARAYREQQHKAAQVRPHKPPASGEIPAMLPQTSR